VAHSFCHKRFKGNDILRRSVTTAANVCAGGDSAKLSHRAFSQIAGI
jgi:hypothetical protein